MKPSRVSQCEHDEEGNGVVYVNSEFLEDRRVYIFQKIDEEVAQAIVYQLVLLNDKDPETPISLLINCPGGEADSCEAIMAAIHMIHAPVNTICMGRAFSAAFLILVCSTGLRLAYEYSTLMMHQPSGGFGGDTTDSRIQCRVMEILWKNHVERLHRRSGQPIELLTAQTERDYYMSAEEAVERNFIDGIIRHEHRARVVLHKPVEPTEDPDEKPSKRHSRARSPEQSESNASRDPNTAKTSTGKAGQKTNKKQRSPKKRGKNRQGNKPPAESQAQPE